MADEPQDAAAEPQASEIEDTVRGLFRQGRYGDAVPVIKEHLASVPDDVAAYELMADALKYSGDKASSAGALATASELYAKRGMVIQSIAAQKKVAKLGVEPDFTKIRSENAGTERVATPLFDDLTDDEFQEVAALLEARSFEQGETAVEEGAAGDSMFVIAGGALEVVVGSPGGPVHLADLGPGDFFGESALLSGRPRTATIRAKSASECLVLSREAFDTLTSRFPRTRQVLEEFNRDRAAHTVEALIKRKQ